MGRTLSIETAEAFEPLLHPSRYKGAHGGRGSSKSWFFGDSLVERCTLDTTRAVCVREVQKSLQQSVKRLLEDRIKFHNLSRDFRILTTHIEGPNDSLIIFQGMQDHTAESIKSLEGFDVAWVEEAQSLSKRSLKLLRPTLRKPGSELWFSWNPRFPTDPVDELLRGPNAPTDARVVQVNYSDNPWFPDVLRAEMQLDRRRDIDLYNHVWLGGYEVNSESRVFKNWRIEEFETPANAAFMFGGDWGFSVDPTVLIRMFIVGRTLYIDWEAYRVGCEIDHTPALFDMLGCTKQHDHTHIVERLRDRNDSASSDCEGMARKWEIVADSARPETISYMQRHGYPRIVAAKKGPDSVREGVQFIKQYDVVIHPRCVQTGKEFTHYSYKLHPLTNEVMPILDDKKNHVIDSVRYALEKVNRNSSLTW